MKDVIVEYTNILIHSSNIHLVMAQLQGLATSLTADNKTIRPSPFLHKKKASDDTTQRFVSPKLVEETVLSSTAHSQLQ
jgi:hypothetical protein